MVELEEMQKHVLLLHLWQNCSPLVTDSLNPAVCGSSMCSQHLDSEINWVWCLHYLHHVRCCVSRKTHVSTCVNQSRTWTFVKRSNAMGKASSTKRLCKSGHQSQHGVTAVLYSRGKFTYSKLWYIILSVLICQHDSCPSDYYRNFINLS